MYERGVMVEKPRQRVHKVLHCRNSSEPYRGLGGTWNRDVNASLNILYLLKLEVRRLPRPTEFMPAEQATRRANRRSGVARRPNVVPRYP